MPKISISIVLYRTDLTLLDKCLAHYQQAVLLLAETVKVEFFLVNNAHQQDGDRLQQWLKTQDYSYAITYIAAAKNGGYGYGHNLAIKGCDADYHVISNADIFVAKEALLNAYQYMEQHPTVGLLSPDVYDLQGQRCYLCKQAPTLTTAILRRLPAWCLNTWAKKQLAAFENRHLNYDQVISDYDFPTGCWMFFRMDKLKALAGFDESYFLYCEDADIGRRLKQIAQMVYVPTVKCQHVWQRASQKSLKLLWIHLLSLMRYKQKFKHFRS